MPHYTYECAAGAEFEVEQRMSDPKLTECPVCGKCTPKRLISAAPEFSLKPGPSGGWANEGYAKPENFRKAERRLGHKVHRKL